MKKRAMSLLLVMVLVFSLLPAAALAADPVNPAQADDADLHMTKALKLENNGTYTVTLESWATGTEHSEKVIQPMDIVLVLDQSGSMDEDIPIAPTEADRVYNLTDRDVRNGSYYVKINGQFYYLHGRNILGFRSVYYNNGSRNVYLFRANWSLSAITLPSDYAYYVSKGTRSKTDAVHDAVDAFVETVANQTNEDGSRVDHRIAIVGFASDDVTKNGNNIWQNTEVFDGSTQTRYDRVTDETLQAALKRLDEDGVATLADSTAALDHDGATCSDKGLDLAKQILDARSETDKQTRGCAVVMFTDGRPGSGSGSSQLTYADYAISKAYDLKNENHATVLTIGVFDEEDSSTMSGSYTIRDYMITTSSDYPTATSIQHVPEEDSAHNPYESEHYKLAGDSSDLVRIFKAFAETIVPETTVTLGSDSVLRDVINTGDFTAAPGASVSAKAVKMSDNTEDTAVTNGLQYSETVPADGVIDVKGFDYAALYHTDTHPGDKLVVTITGLIPNHEGDLESNVAAGVFETSESADPVLSIGSPVLNVAKHTVVVDFNGKIVFAKEANAPAKATSVNGSFGLDGTDAYYQLSNDSLKESTKADSASLNNTYDGADTAVVFGKYGTDTAKTWKYVTAVPASNIYYSDTLVDTKLDVNDQIGYNEDVTHPVVQAVAADKTYSFTFTGSRIDVYATTTPSTGVITATLKQGDTVIERKMVNTKVPTTATRVSAPSVSFSDLSGTYTLEIYAAQQAGFMLEAVRVYNATADNATVEPNAHYINLRDMVLGKDKELTDETDKPLEGALFMDEFTGENPYVEGTEAYKQYVPADYTNLGPKNEVYLEKGQAIAFEVPAGYDVMVSARSPETASGTVTINGKDQPVNNVDMYYPVELDNGAVVIENLTDDMISVMNVKLTTAEEEPVTMTLFSSPQLVSRMAHYVAPVSADNTQAAQQALTELIQQILSNFVRALFENVSRLFGK